VNTYILYIDTPRPNTNRHVHAHKKFGRQSYIVVAIAMVNCLNVKKYILSTVSENVAVSVSQELSDTKS
jgi:hypothetical protein